MKRLFTLRLLSTSLPRLSQLLVALALAGCVASPPEISERTPVIELPASAITDVPEGPELIQINAREVTWSQWLRAERLNTTEATNPIADLGLLPIDFADSTSLLTLLDNDNAGIKPLYWHGDAYRIERTEALTQHQTGNASWYGPGFNGRRTASGETFNMQHLTAAHRTLPFASMIRVTNLSNNLSVVVKVNDRGPFHRDRILDLSYAAARQLGITGGTAAVTIESMKETNGLGTSAPKAAAASPLAAHYRIFLGNYSDPNQAYMLAIRVQGWLPEDIPVGVNRLYGPIQAHVVEIGPISTPLEVNAILHALRAKGLNRVVELPRF